MCDRAGNDDLSTFSLGVEVTYGLQSYKTNCSSEIPISEGGIPEEVSEV